MLSQTLDLFSGGASKCEICGKTLTDPDSIRRGIGPVCACKDGGKIYPITDAASFEVIEQTPEYIIINDVGPWNKFKTVTNAAEWVVKNLASVIKGKRLYYFDSAGRLDEIKHDDAGNFLGFRPGGPKQCETKH